MAKARRITGHVVLEDRKDGPRVFIAKYRRAEGTPTRKVLGPAWAKPAHSKPKRGAPAARRWRVADGPRPDGYLTPQDAQDALDALLTAERAKGVQVARVKPAGRTFGEAVDAYLTYAERVKKIAPSTLNHYRSITRVHLLPSFGADTPMRRVTTARVEEFREALLDEDRLSRSAMRQVMNVLSGVLKRAHSQRWIAHNPAADVESIPMPKASGDFNVLEPVQVEAVARAAAEGWAPVVAGERGKRPSGKPATRVSERMAQALTDQRRADAELYAAMIRFAAYTGLRLGELRALRWRDVAWGNSTVHVRLNAPTSAPAASAEKRPKSELVRSVPLTDEAARAIEPLSRREHFTGPDDRVFPSPNGGLIDGGRVRDAFYVALDAVGLGHLRTKAEPIVLHDLRHSFGTVAVRVAPVTDVQAWMGHADLTTTQRYIHHVPQADAAHRLSQAFAVESRPPARET
ncbi:MAG: site-specific integrase [Solirubrobacterales bacterium]|nr:site-specific integrase [Solirubrobacterales bacterium]